MDFATDITPTFLKEENGRKIFETQITENWLIIVGPNGGLIAAQMLAAMNITQKNQAEPARSARSLTVDYFAPPKLGPAEINTKIIRRGRSLTSVSATMTQQGQINAQAQASFSLPQPDKISWPPEPMPDVPPIEQCAIMPPMLPIHRNYEMRPAFGTLPFSGGARPISGGWTKLNQPPPRLWPETLAAISDAWPPALFSIMRGDDFEPSRGMPTVELSVYFVAPENYHDISGDDPVLAHFETREAASGFFTEDGAIWSRQGALLARVRQIAIAR